MDSHNAVAAVTLLALLVYFWMGIQVAGARRTSGISAPTMTGDPRLERCVRAHENTLEWLPIFLVSLWLFALYWNDMVATALGLVWIVGRILYALGYAEDAGKRSTGFLIQMMAASVLLLGALGKAVWVLIQGGAI